MWYMIGLAMRTCIDLGLHRKGHEQGLPETAIESRRRLFWTVYSLERTIAISLGRPLSISDRQIDVELPALIQLTSPPASRSSSSPSHPVVEAAGGIRLALFLFKLRQIESRIHHSIYRADKPISALLPKLDKHYQALQGWRNSLSAWQQVEASSDLNYPLLHYNRAVRLLIQPFLTLLPGGPAHHYYKLCLRAAGDICQRHKRLHQTLDYGHSFIAVQTVFVSGATMLYAVWTQTGKVWSVALADDVRACSLVLFVMAERAPWVRKYRDAFEMLVDAAMEKLRKSEEAAAAAAAAGLAEVVSARNSTMASQNHGSQVAGVGSIAMVDGFRWEDLSSLDPPRNNEPGEQTNHLIPPSEGADSGAWRVVAELANWIDQDDGSPVWMPDFGTLQNLSGA